MFGARDIGYFVTDEGFGFTVATFYADNRRHWRRPLRGGGKRGLIPYLQTAQGITILPHEH